VVAVVAVVVVILALLALHLHGTTNSVASVAGEPILYSQAVGPAKAAQGKMSGGPWTIDAVVGFGISQSSSGGGGLVNGCTTLWENTSIFLLPATPSNASAGEVSAWFLVSSNPSGDALMTFVSDLSGSIVASNGVELQGSCTSTFTELGAVPTSVVDSSTVAQSAAGLGALSFLSNHPGASTMLGLLGPYWMVELTTCSLPNPSGSGTEFAALFYASNGTLFLNGGVSQVPC